MLNLGLLVQAVADLTREIGPFLPLTYEQGLDTEKFLEGKNLPV